MLTVLGVETLPGSKVARVGVRGIPGSVDAGSFPRNVAEKTSVSPPTVLKVVSY